MMRTLRKGMSLMEMTVVLFVVSYGIMSVYLILSRGWKLAETTTNRIAAINLAREGIEIVSNVRDTNWVKFSANFPSCWKTFNYDQGCVSEPATTASGHWFGSGATASFVPFLSGSLWYFTGATNTGMYLDAVGLPFQTGTLAAAIPITQSKPCQMVDPNSTSCKSNMYRIITIEHPTTPAWCGAGTGCLSVTSRVEWFDRASDKIHTVNLNTILTNWRNNF